MADAETDQVQLAKDVGCTQGAISQILLGKTLKSRYLPDIAHRLGVSLYWLTGKSEDKKAGTPPISEQQVVNLPVTLPNESALTEMFVDLLTAIEVDPHEGGRAETLARQFPSLFANVARFQGGVRSAPKIARAKQLHADDGNLPSSEQ